MIRIAEVIVVASLLMGCQKTMWVPAAGGASIPADRVGAVCELEAERGAPTYGSGSALAIGFQQVKLRQLCMQAAGYVQVAAP